MTDEVDAASAAATHTAEPDESTLQQAPAQSALPPSAGTPNTRAARTSRSLLALLVAASAFAIADVTTTALTGAGRRPGVTALLMLGYVLPLYWLLAGAGWLVFTGTRRGLEPLCGLYPRVNSKGQGARAVLASLPALSFFFGSTYAIVLFATTHFNNHTLAAFLAALLLLLLLGIAVWLWLLLLSALLAQPRANWLRKAQKIAAFALPVPLCAMAFVVIRQNLEGLRIVGPALLVAPLVAAVAWLLSVVLLRRSARARTERAGYWQKGLVAVGLLGCVGSLSIGYAAAATAAAIVRGDLWSGKLIVVGRTLTDFDRDGFSSFWGGGDCAPFDGKRNPGVVDVPRDGIDNDCFNGDREESYQFTPPQRYPRPVAFAGIKNVVVITIEAFRFDALSFLSKDPQGKRITPNIDRLAERSSVFRRTYSSADATVWAMGSLWSTLPPARLVWRRRPSNDLRYLDPGILLFPSVLTQQGFDTQAFVVDFERLRRDAGIDLERAFASYDASASTGRFMSAPSAGLVDKASRVIDKRQRDGRRFLIWLHFIEPHSPYKALPDAPNFGSSGRGVYHSEIWEADRQVGRVVTKLEKAGLLESTAIFITGDHGEAFNEHGKSRHGSRAYEEQIRTIGVLWVPGGEPRIIDAPISHQDIGSTLLNLLDVKADFNALAGRNLLPLLRGEDKLEPASVFAESHAPGGEMVALVKGRYKIVYTKPTGVGELFDLETDPRELVDLSAKEPRIFTSMMEELRAYVETQVAYD